MSEDEIIFESEEILTGSYRQQQAKSFADLETNAKDWKMCEIEHVVGNVVDYIIPQGYLHKQTEISKILNKTIPGEIFATFHCELCGHDIKYLHYIQCDFKQLYLIVGSECVNSFMGAKFVAKEIKHFKDNEIRKNYKVWKEKTLEILSQKYQMRNGVPVINYYTKKPNIVYWAYKCRQKINKTDAETTTARKLKNQMEKVDKIIERGGIL